ncbi:MAG: hypothetical protein JNM94_16755 [Phycisphaerae bacterium]|nr:hypothetical protein [Phycisphaerae bacterium]
MTDGSPDPLPPAPRPSSDDAAFRRIAEEAKLDSSERGRAAYDLAFWDLTLDLPTWHLLVTELDRTAGGAPAFLAAALPIPHADDAAPPRVACAFSSFERATAATRPEFLPLQPGRRSVVTLPRDRACDALCASPLVDALCMNPDDLESSRLLPLRELAASFERRFDRLTPRMFGRFAEAANRGGAAFRVRLIRRLLENAEWWFVATERRRHAPALVAVGDDQFVVPLFTIGEWARRAGPRIVAPLHEGSPLEFPLAPVDGVSYLRRLHERERAGATAVLVNDVRDPAGNGLPGEPAAIPLAELLASAETLGW